MNLGGNTRLVCPIPHLGIQTALEPRKKHCNKYPVESATIDDRLIIKETIYWEHKLGTPDYPTRTNDILRTLIVTSIDRLSVWHSPTSQYNLTFEKVCLLSPPLLSKSLGFYWLPRFLFLRSRACLQSFPLLGSLAPSSPTFSALGVLFLFTLVVVLTGQQVFVMMLQWQI